MRHLGLFEGIGGFALAAEWCWQDEYEPVAFCEIDPYCQRVLARHWPGVPIVGDIRELSADSDSERLGEARGTEGRGGTGGQGSFSCHAESNGRRPRRTRGSDSTDPRKQVAERSLPGIDLLTGGFPCQPFSHAGKRGGTEDDRFLWPEMVRCIQEFQPRWVVGENVAGIYSMEDVFEQVHTDLERCGYEVQAIRIPACAVGAHHRRDRWWFVSHAEHGGQGKLGRGRDVRNFERDVETEERGRNEFESGLGPDGSIQSEPMAHADLAGSQGRDGGELRERRGERPAWAGGSWPQPWPVSEWVAADAEGVQSQGRDNGQGQVELGGSDSGELLELEQVWPAVGGVRRVVDGLPAGMDGYTPVRNRTDRLKALGNAIVPQVAYEIFRAIREVDP